MTNLVAAAAADSSHRAAACLLDEVVASSKHWDSHHFLQENSFRKTLEKQRKILPAGPIVMLPLAGGC